MAIGFGNDGITISGQDFQENIVDLIPAQWLTGNDGNGIASFNPWIDDKCLSGYFGNLGDKFTDIGILLIQCPELIIGHRYGVIGSRL